MSVVKRAGIAAGALGGLAGAAYVAQRTAARRMRRGPDGEAGRALDAPVYIDHRLDTHDRGSIYVVENGRPDDPPIVLSHGVTLSVRTWFHQLEDLPKEGFRAIAFDHRGHGQSVLGEAGHSIENLANDFKTVVEGLDLHDAVLVGHSMGGVAVQSFVTVYPEIAAERVAGIVLLSTLAKHGARLALDAHQGSAREVDGQGARRAVALGRAERSASSRRGSDSASMPRPSHVELVRRMMAECPAETRRDAPRILVGLDLTRDLPQVRVPTLVIGGTADVLTPPSESRRIARLIPGARLDLMRGGGHMLMLEQTETLDQMIVDFAREVRAPPQLGGVSSFPIPGVRAGHVTRVGTGVTVILFPSGSVGSAEVRGGAPVTREIDLLDPLRTVARVDAVVFAGGSAFGLAAADGVMRYLAERGQGYPTATGPVPIVPAACIFDLAETGGALPTAEDGEAAAVAAARDEPLAVGPLGAGTAATVGKWRGREGARPGGVGVASTTVDGAHIAALAVVNAVGDVIAADGRVLVGSSAPAGAVAFPTPAPFEEAATRANTTLCVVVTDARLDKAACALVAQSAHDGFARALRPAHTRFDGDLAVAVATGAVETNLDRLRIAAADVVADAIRSFGR